MNERSGRAGPNPMIACTAGSGGLRARKGHRT